MLGPITSQVKGYPFEVTIPSGSKLDVVILADQVKSFDWRIRKARFICKLPRGTASEVVDKLATLC
ncbi:MAG TPA: type II toxin-antitoxin system PemK/MazF family toxin [Candidatus Binatia bacterium]|nr:type II toxin-antitoxin system PemK/MazF family toxin [Candidatus Binatia bacterium]